MRKPDTYTKAILTVIAVALTFFPGNRFSDHEARLRTIE